METTIVGYIGFRVSGLGFGRNGKEHENNYNGLYRDYSKDQFLHSQLAKGQWVIARGWQSTWMEAIITIMLATRIITIPTIVAK